MGAVFLIVGTAAPVVTAHEADDPCRTTVLQRFEVVRRYPPATDPQQEQILLWSVFGASQVEMRVGNGEWADVDPVGVRIATPIRDTKYWLRITNEADWSLESSVLMDVRERPMFLDYSIDTGRIKAGESAKI